MPTGRAPLTAGDSYTGLGARLHGELHAGRLDLPLPGAGATAARWATLASWGRQDLVFARLAEGHADAVAILAEAGRKPVPGALYGVWASRPGPRLHRPTLRLDGLQRFCCGAHVVDRALVVAEPEPAVESGTVLVDIAAAAPAVQPRTGTWLTAGLQGADTCDVQYERCPVGRGDLVGDPGWYTARPGFALGGGGVAAVWWGGAASLLDHAARHLPAEPDAHQLAHLGEMDALVAAANVLLGSTAASLDLQGRDHALAVARVRSAVERVARDVLERVPRMVGEGPLCHDAALATVHADLGIYLRQHHGERDHAALGALLCRHRDRR